MLEQTARDVSKGLQRIPWTPPALRNEWSGRRKTVFFLVKKLSFEEAKENIRINKPRLFHSIRGEINNSLEMIVNKLYLFFPKNLRM